jgi:porin
MTRSYFRPGLRLLIAALGLYVGTITAMAQAPTAAPPSVLPANPGAAHQPPGSVEVGRLDAPTTPCPDFAVDKSAQPEPAPFGGPLHERPKLTGDWFGTRTALRESGITWDIYNTNFYSGVASGGLDDTFRYRGRADYLLHVDGEKAGLWEGFSSTCTANPCLATISTASPELCCPSVWLRRSPTGTGRLPP